MWSRCSGVELGGKCCTKIRWQVEGDDAFATECHQVRTGKHMHHQYQHFASDEIEPRAFSNTPVGLNFLIAVSVHEGSVSVDPAVPLTDAQLHTNNAILRMRVR